MPEQYEPWRLASIQTQMLLLIYAGLNHRDVVGVITSCWTAMGDPMAYPMRAWVLHTERTLRAESILEEWRRVRHWQDIGDEDQVTLHQGMATLLEDGAFQEGQQLMDLGRRLA